MICISLNFGSFRNAIDVSKAKKGLFKIKEICENLFSSLAPKFKLHPIGAITVKQVHKSQVSKRYSNTCEKDSSTYTPYVSLICHVSKACKDESFNFLILPDYHQPSAHWEGWKIREETSFTPRPRWGRAFRTLIKRLVALQTPNDGDKVLTRKEGLFLGALLTCCCSDLQGTLP